MQGEIKIKVCGMRDAHNIAEVARLRPDFMGFIFYRPSPRYVGDDFKMPDVLSASTRRVGVFVNEATSVIQRKVIEHGLQYVQLHGSESPEQCLEMKALGVGVIKAFSVDDSMDFSITARYCKAADYFLFDTKGKLYGGNAKTFNWDVLSRYDQQVPFFLSGGITPDHIRQIGELGHINLVAIDVNSGVEISPALKDVKKIEAIKAILNTKQ